MSTNVPTVYLEYIMLTVSYCLKFIFPQITPLFRVSKSLLWLCIVNIYPEREKPLTLDVRFF